MSILKGLTAVFAILLYVLPPATAGEHTPPHTVKHTFSHTVVRGSLSALKACDWSRARYWSTRLDRVRPDLGALFRLAWLEIERPPFGFQDSEQSKNFDPDKQLAWKASGEIWADETESTSQNFCVTHSDTKQSLNYDQTPQEVIDALLEPTLRGDFTLPTDISSTLKDFVTYRVVSSRPLPIPSSFVANLRGSLVEKCEWTALQYLSQPTKDPVSFESLLKKCNKLRALLKGLALVSLGDLYFQTRKPKEALQEYQKALPHLSSTFETAALNYRIAMARGLAGNVNDDSILRISHDLLQTDTETEANSNAQLDPILKRQLQTMLCDHLSSIKADHALKLFEKVFSSSHSSSMAVSKAVALTEGCPSGLDPFWNKLLLSNNKTKDQRSIRIGAKLLRLLLQSVLKQNNWKEARRLTLLLARLSQENPLVSYKQFATAVQSPFLVIPKTQKLDLAKLYFKNANDVDLYQQNFINQINKINKTENLLEEDAHASINPLRLPLVLSLPALTAKIKIPTVFRESFDRAANKLLKEGRAP